MIDAPLAAADAVLEAYQDRYLAFVDILGFSNLVSRSVSDLSVIKRLKSALFDISDRASAARSEELNLEVTSFSDTVVISSPVGDAELLHMLQIIDDFGFDLLSKSMLFRGALVRGKVLHSAAYVFGPALIDAYKLETNTSFHPRIMLSPDVYAAIKHAADPLKDQLNKYLVVDAYDLPYINPFARWELGFNADQHLSEMVQLQDIITAGLMAGANYPSVGEKFKWLARKFNRFVARLDLEGKIAKIDLG